MINKIINEINNYDKVLILGFGREGKSTYNLIRKYLPLKKLIIADGNDKLLDNNLFLKDDKSLDFVLGSNYLDNLDGYDLIIKSPGVNFKYIDYSSFEDKITSQIDLFLRYSNVKTIGVTGTKGKSTTSSLIYHILKNMNVNVILGGNIGIPVFDELDNIKDDTVFVIELSCHQLKFVKSSPNISVLLNIFEEHLDLYKSYKDYIDAKLNIFKYQKENNYSIWGLDSPDSYKYYKENINTYAFSCDDEKISKGIIIKEDGLYLDNKLIYEKKRKRNLIGDHNLYNVAAALLVCNILKIDLDKASNYVDNFQSLEHRMEKVGTFKGITFYNDSIATIPSATINCIKSIPNIKTIIIGGMDRGLDLNPLVDYLHNDEKLETCIFLKDTGYTQALENENTVEAENRLANLDEFLTVAMEFEEQEADSELSDFLEGITLSSDLDNMEDAEETVTLMTLHSAKGLEFPVVFLVGMEEGIFPGYKSIGEQSELEEERRLCYVGVTRAKENLFLTNSKQRTTFGSTTHNAPSRFLQEIPKELLDGYEDTNISGVSSRKEDAFGDSGYSWSYGNKNNGNIKTYKVTESQYAAAASSVSKSAGTGFAFRTAESFLNNINKKASGGNVDFSAYQSGTRVYHKKFGEGTINYVEPEGTDLKVDINFDKVGHKRLMAKFANLEIL